MGVYYYTYRKSIKKSAFLHGREVKIGVAEFAASHGYIYGFEGMHATGKREVSRGYNIPKEDQADLIVFGSHDGAFVYKNNKRGTWCDTPMWSGIKDPEDIVGRIFKIKGRNYIAPHGTTIREFIKETFPVLFKTPLRSTQVYVKIHGGYTATVRDITSFEDFLFGFGSDQPYAGFGEGAFGTKTAGEDVPEWFNACVDELIREKQIEIRDKLELA